MINRVLITGHACSGKTTLRKRLDRDWSIPTAPEHTTRPARSFEQDGLDYIFVNDESFDKSVSHFLYTEEYQIDNDTRWRYGLPKQAVNTYGDGLATMIVPVKRVLDIYNQIPDGQGFVVVLTADKTELQNRWNKSRNDADRFDFIYDRDARYIDEIQKRILDKDLYGIQLESCRNRDVTAAYLVGIITHSRRFSQK